MSAVAVLLGFIRSKLKFRGVDISLLDRSLLFAFRNPVLTCSNKKNGVSVFFSALRLYNRCLRQLHANETKARYCVKFTAANSDS